MLKRTLQIMMVVCIITGSSQAANDSFAGKWKLDSSRSRFPADTMKVESAGANQYTFIFSDPNAETIAIDGTDQPGLDGTTLSVSIEGPRLWKVVRKSKGRMLLSANWTLSENGAILRDEYTGYDTNGTPFTTDYVYQRKAGTTGFAGTWQSTSEVFVSPYEIQIQPYEGDGITLIDPIARINKSVKFDGQDCPNSGPGASPDMTSSGRRIGDHLVELTDKMRGKVQSIDNFELSPDLQTLTETQQHPDLAKPTILVFVRE